LYCEIEFHRRRLRQTLSDIDDLYQLTLLSAFEDLTTGIIGGETGGAADG